MKAAILCIVLSLALGIAAQIPCSSSVIYQVEAKCNWTAETHPTNYPNTFPHFSPMCGTMHNAAYTMWAIDGIATPGVELIAETGSPSIFEDEVAVCEASGNCQGGSFFTWTCVPDSGAVTICTFSGSVVASGGYRRLSMLTMLAPSPDWNVGVDSVDFCQRDDESGSEFWIEQYPPSGTLPMYVIDAGTDGGSSYESPNVDLVDFEPITYMTANDSSNIFFNPAMNVVLPICELKISLVQ